MIDRPEKLTKFNDSYVPISSVYEKYPFCEQQECKIIDNLRQWSFEYFLKNKIYSTVTKIPVAKESDFDIIGKVKKAKIRTDIKLDVQVQDAAGQVFMLECNRETFPDV